jgi:two-component system, cell cycle sensor histidine kinase and response regulator CckA
MERKSLFYSPPSEKTHVLENVPEMEARKKVLLLDDDLVLSNMTRLILMENGYDVELASDGVQGIKMIMGGTDYAVILCDMVMPNLAGDMFYMAVERAKPHMCKRFLFMTGHQGDRKIDEFVRKVRGLMLWKPFQTHVLLESIRAVEQKCARS